MGCIILSVNGNTYRITSNTKSNSSFFSEGVDISTSSEENETFIKDLFQGTISDRRYSIQVWENQNWQNSNLSISDFRQQLNKLLEDDKSTLYGYDGDICNADIRSVAEHIQGNRQIGEGQGYNFLYNSSMGSNSFYVFTENRGVTISGISSRKIHNFWFRIYEELKAEQVSDSKIKPITTLINRLYKKEDDSSIYDKLTSLVNADSEKLVHAIGNRYISNKRRFAETVHVSEIKNRIGKESELFAGDIVTIDDTIYMIPSQAKVKGHDDQIYLFNTDTNKKEIIEVRNITSPLYIPTIVTIGDDKYYLLNKNWFSYKKGKFAKVENKKTLESIYEVLNTPNPNVLNLSGKPLLYTLEYGIFSNDRSISDKKDWCDSIIALLPIDTKIECAGETYTKTEDGWFNSKGEKLHGPVTVNTIIFSENSDKNIVTKVKQKLLPLRSRYTKSDIEYMLDQYYSDISSYNDIDDNKEKVVKPTFTFGYRSKYPVFVKYNETNKGLLEPSLVINTNTNIVSDPMYLQEIIAACEFVKKLRTDTEYKSDIDTRISSSKTLTIQKMFNEFRESMTFEQWDEVSKIEDHLVSSLENKTDVVPTEKHFNEAAKLIAALKKVGDLREMCEM